MNDNLWKQNSVIKSLEEFNNKLFIQNSSCLLYRVRSVCLQIAAVNHYPTMINISPGGWNEETEKTCFSSSFALVPCSPISMLN